MKAGKKKHKNGQNNKSESLHPRSVTKADPRVKRRSPISKGREKHTVETVRNIYKMVTPTSSLSNASEYVFSVINFIWQEISFSNMFSVYVMERKNKKGGRGAEWEIK
jgi:hypothetical protein